MSETPGGTYGLVFLGDIMGEPGMAAVRQGIPAILAQEQPLFLVVNAENAAPSGKGLLPAQAEELYALGVDAITLGNHAFDEPAIEPYLNLGKPIVRPANAPMNAPGRGRTSVTKDGIALHLINLCGQVFMKEWEDPFRASLGLVRACDSPHILVDFHAEATSEKIAMGWHLDGQVSLVVGTHTHVATADEQILPGGTAYQTDVGMSGPHGGVIGMDRSAVLAKFTKTSLVRFCVHDGPGMIHGVRVDVDRVTGRAQAIRRLTWST